MTRRVLGLSLPGALVLLALWASAANGCVCGGPAQHAAHALAGADAVIVGVIESERKVAVPTEFPGTGHEHVERVLRGTFGERVKVMTSSDSCGGPIPPGTRIGLFLRADAQGRWWTYACKPGDPDKLIEAARLPAPSGTARYVAAVDAAGLDATSLTADGEPAAYGLRNGAPLALTRCGTGSAMAVRRPNGTLGLVRDDADRSTSIPLTDVAALHCSAAGGRIWAAGERDGRTTVVSVAGTAVTTVHTGSARTAVTFAGGRAYLASARRLTIVTLTTRAVRTVRHPGRFEQLSVSSGRVAGRLANGRGARLDLASGRLRTGGRVDGLVWLSRTTLLDAGNGTVLDSRLAVERRLNGKLGRVVGVEEGSAYLASGRTLLRLMPGAARATVFAELSGRVVGLTTVTPAARLSWHSCEKSAKKPLTT